MRHSVRKLSGTRSLTVPRCKCEKAGIRNPMQGGRTIFVIGASIASPPGVCLSILPVLQDASSREEAKIGGAAQIGNRPCLHGFLVSAFSLSPKQEFTHRYEGMVSSAQPDFLCVSESWHHVQSHFLCLLQLVHLTAL